MQRFTVGLVAILLGGAFLSGGVLRAGAQTQINPAEFSVKIDNPYYTSVPGTTFHYKRSISDGSTETVQTIVTNQTKEVMGVQTRVVWDRAYVDGTLVEDTYDWYAQDKEGNVWYFGEDTMKYENGKVISTEGSWQAGVDGAQQGVIMKANPKVGDSYRQEYYKGHAEDVAEVLSLDQSVTTPYGSYTGCLQTLDTSTLDPKLREHKFYCRKAGGNVALVVDTTTNEREELVNIQTTTDFASLGQSAPPASPSASPGMPTTGEEAGSALIVLLALLGVMTMIGGWLARRSARFRESSH